MDKKLITDYVKNHTKTEAKRENRIRMSEEIWSIVDAIKDARGYTTISEAVEYIVKQGLMGFENAAKKEQAQAQKAQKANEPVHGDTQPPTSAPEQKNRVDIVTHNTAPEAPMASVTGGVTNISTEAPQS